MLSWDKRDFFKCRFYHARDPDEAAVKEAAVQKSYITYILADHSKFGQISSVTFAPLEKACLITDRASDARYKEKCVLKEVLSD